MDVGDEREVKKARRKHKSRETVEREELKALLKLPAARRFIWTVLEDCGIHQLSFSEEETHTAAFLEGRRSIGNAVIKMIDEAIPHTYVDIYREQNKT